MSKRYFILFDSRCGFEIDWDRECIMDSIGLKRDFNEARAHARRSFAGQGAVLWSFPPGKNDNAEMSEPRFEGFIDHD